MSRDPRKLKVFILADDLVADLYRATRDLPIEERYGLQAQMRRAAISVASNIVEGSHRAGPREYGRFLQIALGSAAEVRYLCGLAARLAFLEPEQAERLESRYDEVVRALQGLVDAVDRFRD